MTNDDAPRGGDGTGSREDFHAALSSATLRRVLRYFRSREESTASLQELAEVLGDSGAGGDDVSSTMIRLHHCTLPKLDEFGATDYDPETGTVRFRGHAELESRLPEGPATMSED